MIVIHHPGHVLEMCLSHTYFSDCKKSRRKSKTPESTALTLIGNDSVVLGVFEQFHNSSTKNDKADSEKTGTVIKQICTRRITSFIFI